jgi:phenylalanyl-tRNA synthetase alpha chain
MRMLELQTAVAAAEAAALASISQTGDLAALEALRPSLLGKKSALRAHMKALGSLPADQRPDAGRIINDAQERVESAFAARLAELREVELARRLESERIDITLPAPEPPPGALHPLTLTLLEIERIFVSMGYDVAEGPESETEANNFDLLNILPHHPARDMHDTFYLEAGGILRTHTSPVQVRYMLAHKPPLAIIAPGRVFRVDDVDATHSPVFTQVEGLVVDRGISMAHLRGTLDAFLKAMFGEDVETRFRPSYFPFTEPSAEVDMRWHGAKGGGAWLEVLGCGMVNPAVLENCGIDSREFTGFAFGLGVERFAMLRYGIPTIRAFYENDVRVLRQFA